VLQKDFFRLPESKYRIWAIIFSLAFGISAVFLGFSITAAYFNLGGPVSAPGSFFIRAYGFLAYIVPAYLLYGSLLLADPIYRPGRIFVLCGLILPFLTISIGAYWIREYETLSVESSFIARAGKVGIGFFFFFLTGLEVLLVVLLRLLLFARGQTVVLKKKPAGKQKQGIPDETLPVERNKAQNLNDIYAESAAAIPDVAASLDAAAVPSGISDSPYDDAGAVAMPLEGQLAKPLAEPKRRGHHDDFADEDVEKALAEAEALASVLTAEEAARHGTKKSSSLSGKEHSSRRKRHLPYFIPVEGILKQYPDGEYWIIDDETRDAALTLKETFKEFNIQVEVTGIRKGPVITMFEILPAPGIRLTKIEGLADNIALRLAAQSVRIVAPIPGKHAVGIEVPNVKRNIVSFREIIEGELSGEGKKADLPVVLGKDITGEAVTVDLVQMPHLLIAGATGSGKSVCVNSMILTILYQKPPAECRLILIDPKIVELKLYNDIPHLLTPVITEPKKAFQALQYCIYEMERRYACLDSMGVRDIRSYNKRIKERDIATEYMPYIVVVIDEFADLMATTGKELESTVARLAAMSRAVGIHLVLATQRPSIDVITGLIKANIPSRIAFMVASKMDSRIIIDMVGAEKLLGKGDMLYAGAVDPFPIRLQGAFISEEEVERVVDYVKSLGEPDYIDDEIFYDEEEEDTDPSLFYDGEDPLYEKALEIVMQQGKASASYIQRRLKIGYNRAARLVEQMEHFGIVGPAQGSKPRELLRGAVLN